MAEKSNSPASGMRDLGANDTTLRDYVTEIILKTYREFGYERIETPVLEDIKRLLGSDGGENTTMLFKVLKRGEKLDLTKDKLTEADIVDMGLRFDLTVPLVRYYCNNQGKLPNPFKAIQIGYSWRAERPQKGRFRQFCQCDIDVIGMSEGWIESELLLAAASCLLRLDFSDFKFRINDRRILSGIIEHAGFTREQVPSVSITLDKLDKVGITGVLSELTQKGFEPSAIHKIEAFLQDLSAPQPLSLQSLAEKYFPQVEQAIITGLEKTLLTISALKTEKYSVVFDPTLVRGMGYYTGQIFEIYSPKFGSALGGGGRYDKMVGTSLGRDVPACGISIGFERIINLLEESGFKPPVTSNRVVLFFESAKDPLDQVLSACSKLRAAGKTVLLLERPKKLKNKLLELEQLGYAEFSIYDSTLGVTLRPLNSTNE